jgi:hypothetical protein
MTLATWGVTQVQRANQADPPLRTWDMTMVRLGRRTKYYEYEYSYSFVLFRPSSDCPGLLKGCERCERRMVPSCPCQEAMVPRGAGGSAGPLGS